MTIKFRDARGRRLFRWGKFQIEYWSFPPGFKIEEHSHLNQSIETVVLSGSAHFYRRNPDGIIDNAYVETPKDFLKHFSIPSGYFHWFDVKETGLSVINIERWLTEPTSAAIDIQFPQTK